MFKINIAEEAKKKIAPEEKLLREAQTLLLETGDKDRKFLEAAGLDHQIREAEIDKGKALKSRELRMKYGVPILSEADVKELCIKYHLKCLPSRYYNGTVPPELGSVICRFIEKLGEPNPEYAAEKSLYIMGPKEVFKIQSYKAPVKPRDPVLFYKFFTNEGTYYAIVSKWGNDFTVLRSIKGWLFAKRERYSVVNGFAWFVSFALIFNYFTDTFSGTLWSLAGALAITAIIRGIICNYWTDNGHDRTSSREQIFSEEGWNKSEEVKHSKLFL